MRDKLFSLALGQERVILDLPENKKRLFINMKNAQTQKHNIYTQKSTKPLYVESAVESVKNIAKFSRSNMDNVSNSQKIKVKNDEKIKTPIFDEGYGEKVEKIRQIPRLEDRATGREEKIELPKNEPRGEKGFSFAVSKLEQGKKAKEKEPSYPMQENVLEPSFSFLSRELLEGISNELEFLSLRGASI